MVLGLGFLVGFVLLLEKSSIGKANPTNNPQPKTYNHELQCNVDIEFKALAV